MDNDEWLEQRQTNLNLLEGFKHDLKQQYVWTYLNLSWIVIFGSLFVMGDGFIWGTWDPPGLHDSILLIFVWPAVAGVGFTIGHAIDTANLDSTPEGDYPKVTRWRFTLLALALVGYGLANYWFPNFFRP